VSLASLVRRTALGNFVQRSAALPPATGQSTDLFSIDGGQVLLTGFYGYVTVAIPNVSLDFDLALDPDDGGSDVALASLLAVDNKPAGTWLRLNTTAGGALVDSLNVAYGMQLAVPIALDAGDIKLNVAGGGAVGTTARVKWGMSYVPLDTSARVTAV